MNSQRTKKDEKRGNKNNSAAILTKETFGVVILLFTTLCTVCLITGDGIFYAPGQYVKDFLMGSFGYFSYLVAAWTFSVGVRLLVGKKLKISAKRKFLITLMIITAACFSHIIVMGGGFTSYGEYLKASYLSAEGTYSAGGAVTGLYAYFLQSLLTVVGSAVVVGVLFSVCGYFLISGIVKDGKRVVPTKGFKTSYVRPEDEIMEAERNLKAGVEESGEQETEQQELKVYQPEKKRTVQRLFINDGNGFEYKTRREMAKDDNAIRVDNSATSLNVSGVSGTYSQNYNSEMQKKIEYIKTPAKIDVEEKRTLQSAPRVSDYIVPRKDSGVSGNRSEDIPMIEHDEGFKEDASSRARSFGEKYLNGEGNVRKRAERVAPKKEEKAQNAETDPQPVKDLFALSEENERDESVRAEDKGGDASPVSRMRERSSRKIFDDNPKTAFFSRVQADDNGVDDDADGSESKSAQAPINRQYYRPPLDLLETHRPNPDAPKENHEERIEIIKRVLEEFHINVEPQGYVQGPTITRYEVRMPAGITVKKVLAYDDDLKMRLQSKAGVRIEAPIPGKDLVGIEVANKTPVPVGLKEVLEGAAGQKIKSGSLMFAIGKDIVGNSIMDNLAKGPHYLVAGATGSGKSVCLNVMIVSMLMRYSPEELRLILIDPKRVGFRKYEHLPHLLIDEIITEPQKAVAVLQWAYKEMERRYDEFAKIEGGLVSDIESYNEIVASDTVPKMARIVIVVDELADLMETCKRDMEAQIRMLAQKARAAGIHLVLATQRPSVDVVTGTIKANLPSRIALKVMNFADSSTILAEGGAEKLLGNGDMLYKNSSMSETERYQGAWISDREINNIVTYIKERNAAYFDDELKEFLEKSAKPQQEETAAADGGEDDTEFDDFFLKALWLAVTSNSISIAQLQRRFQIGYARAGGLVDKMERYGFVSPNEGSKARKVLLTREEFENRFGSMPDNY